MLALLKKLKFKDIGTVINAPENWETLFVQSGFKTSFDKELKSNNTIVFVYNKKEFINFLNKQLKYIESDSVLWFAYQKGTSKIKTDINRDIIRVIGEDYNITTVTAISIDDTWSALRFRPIDRVGK